MIAHGIDVDQVRRAEIAGSIKSHLTAAYKRGWDSLLSQQLGTSGDVMLIRISKVLVGEKLVVRSEDGDEEITITVASGPAAQVTEQEIGCSVLSMVRKHDEAMSKLRRRAEHAEDHQRLIWEALLHEADRVEAQGEA